MSGPLEGVRVLEVLGLGAAPYCAMMLADMGAEVIRVERPTAAPVTVRSKDPLDRSRRSIALDLKCPAGVEVLLRLVKSVDILIEGFRPGVAERIGFGPDVCLKLNPSLVYGRLTGWGQDGPLSRVAGHDLNYVALSGLLSQIGPRNAKPVVPLNVIGDFGGGGLLLAFGALCALLNVRRTGAGQVVDAAMLDGAASFMAMLLGMHAEGRWEDAGGANVLSGSCHFYDVYETRDGKYVSLAPLEAAFSAVLIEKLGIDVKRFGGGIDADPAGYIALGNSVWPALAGELTSVFLQRTQAEWCALLEGTDACFAPVLSLSEARFHPHNVARGTFITVDDVVQNAPAPRFAATPNAHPTPPRIPGEDRSEILRALGAGDSELRRWETTGAFGK